MKEMKKVEEIKEEALDEVVGGIGFAPPRYSPFPPIRLPVLPPRWGALPPYVQVMID